MTIIHCQGFFLMPVNANRDDQWNTCKPILNCEKMSVVERLDGNSSSPCLVGPISRSGTLRGAGGCFAFISLTHQVLSNIQPRVCHRVNTQQGFSSVNGQMGDFAGLFSLMYIGSHCLTEHLDIILPVYFNDSIFAKLISMWVQLLGERSPHSPPSYN